MIHIGLSRIYLEEITEVNFIKSMIRNFKKKNQISDIPIPVCRSIHNNHADQTFFEIGFEDLENDRFYCRFLSFRSAIDSRDSLNDMRCSLDGECFQYRFGHESQFFKI